MRYKTIVAASAAAAAAAVIPYGTASASTPDWLTLADVESDNPSLLPAVCGAEATGTLIDPACQSVFGAEQSEFAETLGESMPEAPDGYGFPSVANIDLRDFAKWQVCGIAVAATSDGFECDNSITGEREPVGPSSGISLVNADTTGAFKWSVCGVTVFQEAQTSC